MQKIKHHHIGPQKSEAKLSLFTHFHLNQPFFSLAALCFLFFVLPCLAAEDTTELLGDGDDGNRSCPVHNIRLLDDEGEKIILDDDLIMPFSLRNTCGTCHNYQKISSGWHFNSADPAQTSAGRRGEPWVWVDFNSRTQIPLTQRGWPGTYKPTQMGLSPWNFLLKFARHTPGGNFGEINDEDDQDMLARGELSGRLEINCFACHHADPRQDQSEWALQVARQNFRWSAAAGSGLAQVTGSVSSLPDGYDIFMGAASDDPSVKPPKVAYDKTRFQEKNKVFFDIVREVPARRCYFCHSTQKVSGGCVDRENADEDVHLKSGLTCVDCHRNSIDHAITRGYEGEAAAEKKDSSVETFTCRGCHIGNDGLAGKPGQPGRGRLGAPVPKHVGLPTVHLQKISCTACHSGPKPTSEPAVVKTARIHALGLHGKHSLNEPLPLIYSPVFVRREGKIEPHKLMWPTFWGYLNEDKITPIPPDQVNDFAEDVLSEGTLDDSATWARITPEQITQTLELLAPEEEKANLGSPVYVAGGNVYQRDKAGKLITIEHPAAQPYSWPIAHDVRPAAQSLGAGGCDDCHQTDSDFVFGQVPVDSPLAASAATTRPMHSFQKLDGTHMWAFAASFVFRPMMKVVGFAVSALLLAILLLYGLKGLHRILSGREQS